MGIAGMVLGTLAYFLGKSAVSRINGSQGALGGRSIAVAGWVLGAVAMAIGSAVTLVWIVVVLVATSQPAAGGRPPRVDRITDAFAWPAKAPGWLAKLLIIGLILLIPIVGSINGLGWMLASLDRLRAGEETLAPANLRYIGRGLRLFVVDLAYVLVVGAIAAAVYVPALIVASNQSHSSGNPALLPLAIALTLLAFTVPTLGSLALNFVMPSLVLGTERGGIGGGLHFPAVLRHARANMTNTLIACLMLIAARFIRYLGLVACGIGVLFTTAYALAMQAWVVRSFEIGSPAATAA